MSTTHDFLLEIGTEELPAKNLRSLAETLSQNIKNNLAKAELAHGEIKFFATPRRLAVLVKNLIDQQKSRYVERKGPALKAAFDAHGKPTEACLGFARSCGVDVKQLQTQKTDKGEWLFFSAEQPGDKTEKLLPEIISNAIVNLHLAKPMRWNSHSTLFIRPVHWVVMLFNDKNVSTEILGLATTNATHGHRFHHPEAIAIKHIKDYAKLLETKGKVIADFEQRRENIRQQLKKVAANNDVLIDENLLTEVAGLVEWPVALLGKFETRFLDIPTEVLITAMKMHQKYFTLIDKKQNLLPLFITVANIESKNPTRVIAGNERVLRARLSDAEFFYHTDLKHSLESRLEKLKTVIFQQKLGTQYDKSQRIAHLAAAIAKNINANSQYAARAGLLAKTDLLSEMVGEFPELQGIMGYYYALKDNEPEAVAIAIKEHYQPRFSRDILPKTIIGSAIAIADRIDTLVGIFGIKQAPTGEKDPFGLRRAALGILRIIIENKLILDLKELLTNSLQTYQNRLDNDNVIHETLNFILERLRAWYAEQQISAEVFAAVMARNITEPLDFDQRIHAVQHFQNLPEATALAAANKRVSNILKKQDGISIHQQINPNLFEHEAERNLADLLEKKSKEVEQLYQQKNYTEILTSLATLQKPIDYFFDKVMVNVDNEKLRNNRLALLAHLRNLFLQVADVSLLPG